MRRSDGSRGEKGLWFSAKGQEASRLRRRKFALVRELGLPQDLLAGSLVVSHRRCGRSNCWCVDGEGHEQATLTYSVDGSKHVQSIPLELVEPLREQVELGSRYRDAVQELRVINAQLLGLWFVEKREERTRKQRKKIRTRKAHGRRSRS